MCGLFGWQFQDGAPKNMAVISSVLQYAMAERGLDSWGVLANGRKMIKGMGSITDAAYARKLCDLPSVAAHTRYATTGDRTKANSHPFVCGSIIGMHNGIVYNHLSLNSRFDRECEVDSQHIFHHLDENRPLSDITGYGAIVWARKDVSNTLYMGRFNAGELAVVRIKDGTKTRGVAWASTASSLDAAVTMAGYTPAGIRIDAGAIYSVHGGDIYTTDRTIDIAQKTWPAETRTSTKSLPWPKDEEDKDWASSWHYEHGQWVKSRKYLDMCATCYEYMDKCNCTDCYCPACVDDGDWRKWSKETEKVG